MTWALWPLAIGLPVYDGSLRLWAMRAPRSGIDSDPERGMELAVIEKQSKGQDTLNSGEGSEAQGMTVVDPWDNESQESPPPVYYPASSST